MSLYGHNLPSCGKPYLISVEAHYAQHLPAQSARISAEMLSATVSAVHLCLVPHAFLCVAFAAQETIPGSVVYKYVDDIAHTQGQELCNPR